MSETQQIFWMVATIQPWVMLTVGLFIYALTKPHTHAGN